MHTIRFALLFLAMTYSYALFPVQASLVRLEGDPTLTGLCEVWTKISLTAEITWVTLPENDTCAFEVSPPSSKTERPLVRIWQPEPDPASETLPRHTIRRWHTIREDTPVSFDSGVYHGPANPASTGGFTLLKRQPLAWEPGCPARFLSMHIRLHTDGWLEARYLMADFEQYRAAGSITARHSPVTLGFLKNPDDEETL